jgi:hypothetical protein
MAAMKTKAANTTTNIRFFMRAKPPPSTHDASSRTSRSGPAATLWEPNRGL